MISSLTDLQDDEEAMQKRWCKTFELLSTL